MKYTVDYFIHKFEAIPEDNWIIGELKDPEVGYCVLGWCNVKADEEGNYLHTEESEALMYYIPSPYSVNDGSGDEPTPKQRILGALYRKRALISSKETK